MLTAQKKITAVVELPANAYLHIKGCGGVVEPGIHPMSSPLSVL